MELVFLGTGTGIPSSTRGAPGIIVETHNECLLFDSGPGTLWRMYNAEFTYDDIDWIFYTHFHVDHISDMASFLFATKYTVSPRTKSLKIVGPKGTKEFYNKLVDLYGDQIVSNAYVLTLREIAENEIHGRDWKISALPLQHTKESIGYRITEEDKVVVYSGDTTYCKNIVRLAENADLLILECAFPEEVEVHLTPELAGRVAREANVKRLVLTHFYPPCDKHNIMDRCKKEFDGDVVIAHDLMRIEV
jgi:ribonuclease BN (tRNA processing enzyme)